MSLPTGSLRADMSLVYRLCTNENIKGVTVRLQDIDLVGPPARTEFFMNLRPVCLNIVVADRNLERALSITAALVADGHHVVRAHDAVSVLALAREHVPHAVLIDPNLAGADGYQLARRLRRGILPASSAILGLTGTDQGPETRESELAVDYQIPARFDVVQLSGLIHYARKTRP